MFYFQGIHSEFFSFELPDPKIYNFIIDISALEVIFLITYFASLSTLSEIWPKGCLNSDKHQNVFGPILKTRN